MGGARRVGASAGPCSPSAGGGGDIGHNAIVAWLPDSGPAIAVASNLSADLGRRSCWRRSGRRSRAATRCPLPEAAAGRRRPGAPRGARGRLRAARGGGRFDVAAPRRPAGDRRRAARAAVRGAVPAAGAMSPRGRRGARAAGARAARRRDARRARGSARRSSRSFGPIARRRGSGGSLVVDGELRTYVTVAVPGASVRAWYALNAQGGVGGGAGAGRPAGGRARSRPARGRFRPDDPTGAAPPT